MKKNNKHENEFVVSKNDLISVALLYNFLANESDTISINRVNAYYGFISNFNYYRPKYQFKFVNPENSSLNNSDIFSSEKILNEELKKNGIIKNDSDYQIDSISDIIRIYKSIPEEVLNRSLSKKALTMIGVDRDNLKIDSITRKSDAFMNVYSMSEVSAGISVKNRLRECGYSNIRIKNINYKGIINHSLFKVYYSADIKSDIVDLEKQMIKK